MIPVFAAILGNLVYLMDVAAILLTLTSIASIRICEPALFAHDLFCQIVGPCHRGRPGTQAVGEDQAALAFVALVSSPGTPT